MRKIRRIHRNGTAIRQLLLSHENEGFLKEAKKESYILSCPQRLAFSDGSGRLTNVTSSTPFFGVFCIDAVSTEGSEAEVR
jgi:hypothetical protein